MDTDDRQDARKLVLADDDEDDVAGIVRIEVLERPSWPALKCPDLQSRGDAGQVTVFGKDGKAGVVLLRESAVG